MALVLSTYAARRRELCDFLKYARSRITPLDAGIATNGRRRVRGLRRDEVAALCAVSATWYTWFETGRPNVRASPRLIASVARTLQLEPAETTYLFSLAIPEMPRMKCPVLGHVEWTLETLLCTQPNKQQPDLTALHEACDLFPVGVYCTTVNGRIIYANNALVTLLGYKSKAAYMSLNVSRDLYHDAQARIMWQRDIDDAGSLRDILTKVRRAHDEIVCVRDTATVIRGADDAVSCYLGIWHPGE